MRFITTSLPDDVHPECVEHQNTSVAFCVSRLRRDRTFLAPLPFQAQNGHTEAHGEYRWGSPHFMRTTSSPLIACSWFRTVEGACCVWPVQIEDTAFCLATQESGLTTCGASVQQQQVCSRAIGTPPQGMSAAVFESTSSRVVCSVVVLR